MTLQKTQHISTASTTIGSEDTDTRASLDRTSSRADIEDRMRHHAPKAKKHIAVVTMGVKLGDETRGYTRFRKIAELLVAAGYDVDLITTSFQHWEKAQRDITKACYHNLPYRVIFIHEPGYKRNIDIRRIHSHTVAARNLANFFGENPWKYDLLYSEIPPNNIARVCAEAAHAQGVPYIVDVNDLWPEAMRMVFNVPGISDVLYHGFTRDAHIVYNLMSAAVGTSDEYAMRPQKDRTSPYPHITVYVGNDLARFDAGVTTYASQITKPKNEIWATYAGTLGASYGLESLIRAAAVVAKTHPAFRLKILGDGPERQKLRNVAVETNAPVDFLGYKDYPKMAAWLSKSDITVNSLCRGAAQSIVTKIGDYLASGHPILNTGSSSEFCKKVSDDGIGINAQADNVADIAAGLCRLIENPSMRKIMGTHARIIAEEQFNQNTSYQKIVHLVQTLLA